MEIIKKIDCGNIDELALSIPKNVKRDTLRCDRKGNMYAEHLYKANGYYANLISSLNKIIDYCDKALNNTVYCSSVTKPLLLDTKRLACKQIKECVKRMEEIKLSYNLTADIVTAMKK